MLTDPKIAMEIIMRSQEDDPKAIWQRLGIEANVAGAISLLTGEMLNVNDTDALVLMELGALLAEAGMEYEE